ncbi:MULTISPECIES: hypothetical protein [unclassified Streptomyces]|uniref:hypothetical protein n=1 Tax=unclassified Streptomyces TaxID=2593676 RepID=UPI0006F2096D|nr:MULTISPECIES: hypothetical protein [unclassified Streptomyces]KQX52643.1 hypothetical protein ASD33_05015 [Streptomyces sp. Root1304]KRA89557.1 hypothetical protein ASE09_05020 [Streptomyces sp. Root66D1]
MMPQTPTPRVCSHCDGFPVVHITTGSVTPDGQRRTLAAACPICKGSGRTVPAVLVRAGR